MTTFGNSLPRRATEEAVRSPQRFLTLSGPEHVGKRSFVQGLLESVLDESDLMIAETGPDGARQARPFLSDRPSFSPFRAVFVDDMDFLSEPAQDSWLKLCEETPQGSCIVAIVSDPSALLPPLLSRVTRDVRWSPLSEPDLLEFASSLDRGVDQVGIRMCRGLPGLYSELCSPAYVALHESVISSVSSPSFELPVPSAIKDLDAGRSAARSAASLVVRRAALSLVGDPVLRPAALSFLRFAGNIVRVPSSNAEIHWRCAQVSFLKM